MATTLEMPTPARRSTRATFVPPADLPAQLPAVTGLASWFGSNRTLAANVGVELAACRHVTVPFAGSMTELLHIRARSLVVADVHRHLINLAGVVADRPLCLALYARLRRLPFHPDVLAAAQRRCREREDAWAAAAPGLFAGPAFAAEVPGEERLAWAADYFVTSWMGQGGRGGTKQEFTGNLSVRYDAGGGDSNRRFRSAAHSLLTWNRFVERRSTFEVADFRALLDKVRDLDNCGVYADPPFVKEGGGYRYPFGVQDHHDLAERLGALRRARVCVRYYDHEMVRRLYPASKGWVYRTFDGRNQHNERGRPEVLILNGPSLAPAEEPR